MELLQGEAFDNLFRTCARSAFHLEVHDTYRTPDETGPFNLFLTGQPDDFAWHQPWLTLVRDVTQAGKSITRVRVVSVPHADYTRWGLSVAPLNIEAGEDIRWLPRRLTEGIELPADDFWFIDDDRVVFTVFEPNGQFAGGAATTDPVLVDRYRRIHRQVWALAIPHRDYVTAS
jgi:Family of unknown function (DUF6879)